MMPLVVVFFYQLGLLGTDFHAVVCGQRARMLMNTGKAFTDPSAITTRMREDSDFLLELATFNDLVLANTFGHHKASR